MKLTSRDSYDNAIREVAGTTKLCVDFTQLFGSYALAQPLGLYFDTTTHLNEYGYRMCAKEFAQLFN